jgi:hypothetical protein
MKRPHSEKVDPVPTPEITHKRSASASPHLPATARKVPVHAQHVDARLPVSPSHDGKVLKCPKQRNEIQLLQRQIDELKRIEQDAHDLFVLAALHDDESDADEFLGMRIAIRSEIQKLKSEVKRKRAQVANTSSSNHTGGISVEPYTCMT